MPQLGDEEAGEVVRKRREEVERQSDTDTKRIDKNDGESVGAPRGIGNKAAVDSEPSLVHQARFRLRAQKVADVWRSSCSRQSELRMAYSQDSARTWERCKRSEAFIDEV